jgi:beta-barrel assembly-enhancing protease
MWHPLLSRFGAPSLVRICLTGMFVLGAYAHGQPPIEITAGSPLSPTPRLNSIMALDCGKSAAAAKTARSQMNLRRQAADWVLGNELATNIEQHTRMITDFVIARYLNRLEQNIVRSSGLDGCFIVKVMSDPDPNAYSLPGGFIYVTSGLILTVDSEGQLVAALAHETAHVTSRQLIKIAGQRRTWGRLILLGGPAGYALRRYVGPLLTMKLLRDAEFQADQAGLRYQVAAGYDPAEFGRLLQSVPKEDEKADSFFDRLYEEHPLITTRANRLKEAERRIPILQTGYFTDSSEFLEIKTRLAAMTPNANNK